MTRDYLDKIGDYTDITLTQLPDCLRGEWAYSMRSQNYSWRSAEFSYASYILQGKQECT